MAKSQETEAERIAREQHEYLISPHTPKQRELPRNYQPPKDSKKRKEK